MTIAMIGLAIAAAYTPDPAAANQVRVRTPQHDAAQADMPASQLPKRGNEARVPPSAAATPDDTPALGQPAATAVTFAATGKAPPDNRLLGNGWGVRDDLRDMGFTLTGQYLGQLVSNVRGGTRNATLLAGQLSLGVGADLRKLSGSIPGTFQLGVARRHGEAFNAASGINALVNPQSIVGRGEIWRISQFWYSTDIIVGTNVKIGRMVLNEDFNQARCDFISGYFCLGENVRTANTAWPTNPVSQWGVRVQQRLSGNVSAKAAIYQYNPKNLDVDRPLYLGFAGANGMTIPAEINYAPRMRGLPGSYTVGVVFSNAEANDPVLNTAGQLRAIYGGSALVRRAEWGMWLNARQQLKAAAPDGGGALSAFANVSLFSPQSAGNRSVAAIGINYTGLIPSRPRDEIGFAIGRARLNERITEAARTVNASGMATVAVRTSEVAAELNYAVGIIRGFTLQPDVQIIVHPGGDTDRRTAVVVGSRLLLTL